MSNQKISQMTYKQLAADDEFPTVNSSSLANTKALGGDIPLLVGILQWNVSTIYTEGQIVIYNSANVSGMFRVKTTTVAGDAPEGVGFDKFESYSIAWRENTFNVTQNSPDYFVNIEGKRTGRITFTDSISVGVSILVVLTGDWASGANKNLIVTDNNSNGTDSGESYAISYSSGQITINCRTSRNYTAGTFKFKFTLHG